MADEPNKASVTPGYLEKTSVPVARDRLLPLRRAARRVQKVSGGVTTVFVYDAQGS